LSAYDAVALREAIVSRRKTMPSFSSFRALLPYVLLLASTQGALAGMLVPQCPPNSHMAAVAIPGNLRAAHCWCNVGYINVAGVCVPAPPGQQPSGVRAPLETRTMPIR